MLYPLSYEGMNPKYASAALTCPPVFAVNVLVRGLRFGCNSLAGPTFSCSIRSIQSDARASCLEEFESLSSQQHSSSLHLFPRSRKTMKRRGPVWTLPTSNQ